jgi:hypothetical protein
MVSVLILYAILAVSPLLAQSPQITNGLGYLTSSQNPDGAWTSATTLVETTAATVSALETLKLLNQTAGTSYTAGVSWLQGRSPVTVDYIAERIRALSLADGSVNALIPSRDPVKGAWGGYAEFDLNFVDTSLALQALKTASYTDLSVSNAALAYLTGGQNSDGGWGFHSGADSNVYITAIVSATLQQFPQMTTIATAVNKATSFLLAHQNVDGGFGSSPSTVYETALAYSAILAVSTDATVLDGAVNYLTRAQSANGSWNDDPYSTALALKALYLSENKPAPPPPPPAGGKITGTVIDATTNQRLSGVAVVLESNQLINTTTDAAGVFALNDIQPGSQKVNISLQGYKSSSVTTTIVVDATASLGNIPLVSTYSTGTIAGVISDSSGKPLADVAISVTGAWSGSAVTRADGGFSFTYVTPGAVTITAAKAGYQTVTSTGTVYARTTLSFSPRLSTTPSQATTGILVGRVVEDTWGLPIDHLPGEQGVTVTISGGVSVAVDADNGGYFTIQNLPPNTYQVTVGMPGFTSRTFRVVIMPGVTTDMGTIRLSMTVSKMTLTGKVTDEKTGAPIPGAEVTISGKDLTGRADFAGTYAIADIDHPSEFTLKASATGYTGRSYIVRTSPWTQTMDIALTPFVTTGSLKGTVVDAATSQPLEGVTLTPVSDPALIATTDSTGAFIFSAVPQGPQQVTLALNGYAQRTLTTAITAGALNDVGTIALSVTPLPAAIQGTVRDAVANAPFAGVDIQVTGTGSMQTVTAADGTYQLAGVTPGMVTVAATATAKPAYNSARFTGKLEPGGLVVFSPSLSTTPTSTVDVTIQTDKAIYVKGDTVAISINLQNRQAMEYLASLHVMVSDPSGVTLYDTTQDLTLADDSTIGQNMSFVLPLSASGGTYKILAGLYGVNGVMLGAGTKSFGVATSQISITPTLPAVFRSGPNEVSFNVTNMGNLAVATGVLGVTLKDPDGVVVSTTTDGFSLGIGESKTFTPMVSIPALKFGTYTLSYTESDETKTGQATDISLPNTVAIAPLFDNTSHRIRETANLTVSLGNTGRFNLDTGSSSQVIAVLAEVPDAAYAETKTLTAVPVAGNASESVLLFSFDIPETLTPGQHGTRITVTLPSGSTTVQTTQLAIMESSLTLSPIQATYTAGDTIRPVIANSGGVDTQVQYKLSLYDAKSSLIAEYSNTDTVAAGSTLSLGIAIPAGAVDGNYNLMVNYKDVKTGKEGMVPNALTISGVKGSLQVQTNKEYYLLTENITGASSMTSSGTPLTGGNLHLQVTTGAGVQKAKTWTTQADFQTGVRNGVDTYGVNDWIIPDDDFSGTAVNKDRWANNVYNGGAIPTNAGEQLQLATSGAINSTSAVLSKFHLEGDFDIQVDYEINPFANNNSHAVFIASFDDGTYFRVGRHGNYYQSYMIWPDTNQTTYGTDTKGKLRLTRTGNVAKTWYWSGSQWINHVTWTVSTAPVRIQLLATSYLGTEQMLVKFDNFKVNSGRIKTENQTVDSVRLLPLNDNFEDGVLNLDRWIESGSNASSESAGVLHMQSNSSSPSNGIQLRASLTGDFSAVSSYRNFATTPSVAHNGSLYLWANIGTSGFYVNRASDDLSRAGGQFVVGLSNVNGTHFMGTEVPYPSQSGLLRLRRVGSSGFDEFWDGAKWVTVFSDSRMPLSSANIELAAVSAWNNPITQVDLDSFYTDNGTYAEHGILTLKFDSGRSGNKWGTFLYTSSQPVGTSIKFRTRTAETEAGLATATWSDYLTASGSPVNSPPARWVEIEATLATTDTNITPLLNEVTVTSEINSGEILWQADGPANLVQGVVTDVNNTIGTLGMTGKFYLEGSLTSSTGQTVATAEYPFYVEQGDIQVSLAADKKVYRPGETVTITGKVKNLSSIAATGLTAWVQGTGVATPYSDTFDLPATSDHPFSITSTAGSAGIYRFTGSVTQNSVSLADVADQYEVANPVVSATLTAPDTVGNTPFTVSVSLNNTGKVNAATDVLISGDGGQVIDSQTITLPAGGSRMLQYNRQISDDAEYTAIFTGDLNQTITKKVAYTSTNLVNSVSAKIVKDKISYNPNEQVTLTSTLTSSAIIENLSAQIIVTNSQGQGVYSTATAIPIINQGQTTTIKKYWNTGTNPAGTYLITLQVLNAAGVVIAKSTCDLVISSTTSPKALLNGQISLDKQNILTGEPVTVSYGVTNVGNVDLSGVALSVQTINLAEETVYNTIADQAALAMGASYTKTGPIDTTGYSAKDYLVVLRASIGGVEETLAGTFFRVEGAPSAPALISPVNGADVDAFTPALTVSNASDPNDEKLTYEFEIYAESGLTTLISSGTVSETAGATAWAPAAPLTENLTYFWRARAWDEKLYGPWMAPASFRVNTVNDSPTAPTISSPADGTDVAVLTPALIVNNVTDPDSANLTYNFDIALDPGFTQIVATAKGIAGGQGTTSWTVPIALRENGRYYWRAQADDWLIEGPWSITARFQVNTANDAPGAPVITSPINGSTVTALETDVVVANSIDPDSTELTYYFEADTAPTFDSPDIIRSGAVAEGEAGTIWHINGLRDNMHYYLRVKAGDGAADSPWSAVTEFTANTVNDPPTTPILDNPSNGAGVTVFTPTLSVQNSTDSDKDVLTYEFEVYADAALTTLVIDTAGVTGTGRITSWIVPVSLTENQTYYWRARANDGSLQSPWMPQASFTINTANDAPGAPALLSPTDGSTISTLTPVLTLLNAVDPDSDSLSYEYEVYQGSVLVTGITNVPENVAGETSATLTTILADNTAYQWRARAFDGDRYGPWTAMATFTTHVNTRITVDIDFEPETLNKKDCGKWVVVRIELPHGYRAKDVDISSIRLEGAVHAELWPHECHYHHHEHGCDHDRHGHHHEVLMVKFKRSEVIAVLPEGKRVPVHVTGMVKSTPFEGVDIIKVTSSGHCCGGH